MDPGFVLHILDESLAVPMISYCQFLHRQLLLDTNMRTEAPECRAVVSVL